MTAKRNKGLDPVYIQLRKGRVVETVEPRPGVLIDLDRKGQVIGIEVLPGMSKMKRQL